MKLVSQCELNGWDDGASRIIVYALESEEERNELEETDEEDILDLLGYYEERNVAPGAVYHRYRTHITYYHFIVEEIVALNV